MKCLLLAGLASAALAGCATPQYPVQQAHATPLVASRNTAGAPQPAPAPVAAPPVATNAAGETESPPTTVTAAPAPGPVETAQLAPLPPPPATETVGPPPAPAITEPPPLAYAPPRPVRRTEVRTVTDGKVISAHGMYRDYQVQSGDHLDAIARDLNTERDELISANHLRRPYRLHPGDHIKVPVAKAYVVVRGDTMAAVAKRFGVGLGALASLNDLPERGRLTPGMFIALPANFDDHGPSRETFTEEVYAAARPRATYRASAPQATDTPRHPVGQYAPPPAVRPTYQPAPYVPSAEALATAASRTAPTPLPPSSAPAYVTPRVVGAYGTPRTVAPTPSYTAPRATSTYLAQRPSPAYVAPRSQPEATVNTAALAGLAQGRFIWPVKGSILSPFGGAGMGRRNDGVDIGAPEGSEVRAVAVGQVVYAGDQVPGFGNLVLIKHAGGWVSAYAHLANVNVHMQDEVYQGQQVGTVGETGGVNQPQLHFELRYAANPSDKARPLDPLLILPR